MLISGLLSQTYLQNHRFEERLQLLNKLLHYVVSLQLTPISVNVEDETLNQGIDDQTY